MPSYILSLSATRNRSRTSIVQWKSPQISFALLWLCDCVICICRLYISFYPSHLAHLKRTKSKNITSVSHIPQHLAPPPLICSEHSKIIPQGASTQHWRQCHTQMCTQNIYTIYSINKIKDSYIYRSVLRVCCAGVIYCGHDIEGLYIVVHNLKRVVTRVSISYINMFPQNVQRCTILTCCHHI